MTYKQLHARIDEIMGKESDIGDAFSHMIDILFLKSEWNKNTHDDIVRAFMFSVPSDQLRVIVDDITRARPSEGHVSHVLFHIDRVITFVRARIDAGERDHWTLCNACAREFALYRNDMFPVWMSRVIDGELRDASDGMREEIPPQ